MNSLLEDQDQVAEATSETWFLSPLVMSLSYKVLFCSIVDVHLLSIQQPVLKEKNKCGIKSKNNNIKLKTQ
jgi:hypothetical protein